MAVSPSASLSSVTGTPTVVRGEQRSLFAFHHVPPGPDQRSVAIVMCPAIGFEALSAYRTYRHAAEHLAALGFHVLRFDYFGTGNSGGDASEVAHLVADVHAAIEELKQLAGVAKVCLFGTRAGGLLAAQAAAQRDDIVGLALLATPASGRLYVREQKAFQALSSGAAEESSNGLNVAGFSFSEAMLEELGQINVAQLEFPSDPRVLILSRDDISDDGRLLRHFNGMRCEVRQVAVAGYAAMMTTVETSTIPKRLLENLWQWCDESYPDKMRQMDSRAHSVMTVRSASQVDAVSEEAFRFGPEQRMFGIVTQPLESLTAAKKHSAVLLLNVGANHHIGSGRLYVGLARELAAQGTTVLRFDISGLGESYAAPGKSENVIYDPDSIADVESAMQYLSERYQITEFILGGVCLGAHLAFYAAPLDSRVVGQILVNLAVFERQVIGAEDTQSRKSFKARSAYAQAIFNATTWRRLFKGQIAVFSVTSHLVLQSCRIAMFEIKRGIYNLLDLGAATNAVEHQLRSVLQRGVRTLLVYSEGDPALDSLALYFGADAGRVRRFGHFEMRLVAGADHTFNQSAAQRELRSTILEFVGTQAMSRSTKKNTA